MTLDDEILLLGKKIAAARQMQNLSQTELANRIGRDHPAINRVEKGKTNPTYKFLLSICSGLNLTLVELLNTEVDK